MAKAKGKAKARGGGKLREVRIGIGFKFAFGSSLATALLFAAMGMVLHDQAASRQDRQLDEQGVFSVKIAAAPELDSWRSDYNTLSNLYDRVTRIEARLEIASGGALSGSAESGSRAEAIRRKIEALDKEQRRFNARRLQGLIKGQGALDLWVIDADGRLLASASGRTKIDVAERMDRIPTSSPETRIGTGSYQVEDDGPWTWARFFVHPIKDREGARTGSVYLALSETELRAAKSKLRNTTIGFVIAGILIGAGVSFFIARTVTSPLATLMQDVRFLAAGRLEHRIRSRSSDEIGALASAIDHMTRELLSARGLQEDLAEKEHQLALATEVQERLFPRELPRLEGLSLMAGHEIADELSSDLFDAMDLGEGRLGILVMSASGRGVASAIVLSMARALFRSLAPRHRDAASTLREMNRILAPDLRRGLFVSASYAVLESDGGGVHLASAGPRVPVVHFRREADGVRPLLPDGMALGLDAGPVFDADLQEMSFDLAPGDRLILATEGVALLAGPDGEALGPRPFLQEALRSSKGGTTASALLESLLARGQEPREHDVTVVIAEYGA